MELPPNPTVTEDTVNHVCETLFREPLGLCCCFEGTGSCFIAEHFPPAATAHVHAQCQEKHLSVRKQKGTQPVTRMHDRYPADQAEANLSLP